MGPGPQRADRLRRRPLSFLFCPEYCTVSRSRHCILCSDQRSHLLFLAQICANDPRLFCPRRDPGRALFCLLASQPISPLVNFTIPTDRHDSCCAAITHPPHGDLTPSRPRPNEGVWRQVTRTVASKHPSIIISLPGLPSGPGPGSGVLSVSRAHPRPPQVCAALSAPIRVWVYTTATIPFVALCEADQCQKATAFLVPRPDPLPFRP